MFCTLCVNRLEFVYQNNVDSSTIGNMDFFKCQVELKLLLTGVIRNCHLALVLMHQCDNSRNAVILH